MVVHSSAQLPMNRLDLLSRRIQLAGLSAVLVTSVSCGGPDFHALSSAYWVSGQAIVRAAAQPSSQTAVMVASTIPSTPDRLASDGSNVYFGAAGSDGIGIYSVPSSGGTFPALIAKAVQGVTPTAVFTLGGYIYWAENATNPVIRRVIAP
jgi:hypothetical protein